jgi:hypothetical protein
VKANARFALIAGLLVGAFISSLFVERPATRVVTSGAGRPGVTAATGGARGDAGAPSAGVNEPGAAAASGATAAVAHAATAVGVTANGAARGHGGVRGVNDSTIKLGVAYLDLGPVKYASPEYDIGDVEGQWRALVDGWRRDKLLPVNGRDIELHFRKYSVLDSTEQRAACVGLVQDEQVFAVDAPEFFYQVGSECVAADQKTPILTAEGPSDAVMARSMPYLFVMHTTSSRMLRHLVRWADRRGLVHGHRLGVYHLDDPLTRALVDSTIKAELKAMGESLAAEDETAHSVGGPEDALAVQHFQAAHVDVALLLTSRGGFMQQADAQGYQTTYIDSDYEGGTTDTGTATYPADQFEGSYGTTAWKRGEPASGVPRSAAEDACVRNYERASGRTVSRPGPGGHETGEWTFVVIGCDEGRVLLEALRSAGRDLTPAAFLAAMERIQMRGLIRFADISFGPRKHTGADGQRTLQWQGDCRCWRTRGPFEPFLA